MGSAGNHDDRGDRLPIERERVIDPRLEYRRRPPVIVGRSQDHDGVRRTTLIVAADPPYPDQEPCEQDAAHQQGAG